MPAIAGNGSGQSQEAEIIPPFPQKCQGPEYLSHHLLLLMAYVSKKLESGAGAGLKLDSQIQGMGIRHTTEPSCLIPHMGSHPWDMDEM